MRDYRFYFLSADGRIDGPSRDHRCPDDDAALIEAKQLLDGQAIEIWQGKRKVARIDPDIT
ncbi:MAG: hypothetical protein Q8M18_19485 [Bradyrhizobium sp.]|nr:hypothetical protein [Bradyrhizobium sp.]